MSHRTHHHCAKSVFFFHFHENVKVVLGFVIIAVFEILIVSVKEKFLNNIHTISYATDTP